ncbi:MAG: polynucleotide adenylyltransferase/metal dependent phosphohydrolase [Candidatus Doudnabacteria bacterium Gr01-1014_77]|uniref:Polynucleotide adenylyltransferase/metal dependent phosphohydrolase n=1 Tax=Candidatus Doudnabacteria bacterium Gr01-1014_77 TaxID=2017133 RepID=A0A554JAV3_9BACT|nr:MAG: polynucleotide adenylyltransferase/metal dependent phosphohydrolase [Candidatus Doudnabacteria bacterium Gr01-1014_77]
MKEAERICSLLSKQGYETYIVGGFVRDMLLGISGFDLDIATSAKPFETKKILNKHGFKIYEAGEKFGTIGVVSPKGNVEITTFRKEGMYSDSRRPSKVSFVLSVKEDSKRRDFTINSIYYNPATHEFLDWHEGLKDLKNKEIKFVGSAFKRIKEDPLRMLRAVRFAAKLGFNINKKDLSVIKKNSKLIRKTSAQRIKEELDRIISQ